MELKLKRRKLYDDCTIGDLLINDKFECYILEDRDRGLAQTMSLEEIKKYKVHGKTAIPRGRYQVVNTYSNRFKKYLPLLVGVPGYEGVRIHPGNKHEDTEGCLLPGNGFTTNSVTSSRIAFKELFDKILVAEKKEKIFINIE